MSIRLPKNTFAAIVSVLLLFLSLPFTRLLAQSTADASPTLVFRLPEVRTNSLYVRERLWRIPRVSPQYYEAKVLLVKTKTRQLVKSGGGTFQSSPLNAALAPLGIRSIRAPFASTPGATILSTSPFGVERIYEVQYNADVDAYDACLLLLDNPDIEYATPLFVRYTSLQPNDPLYSAQYAMQRIQMDKGWDITQGSQNVTIAIVDSGTDFEHEDLAGNMWINPGEDGNDTQGKSKRSNGKDDDGNGKIDDWRGWDFIGNISYNEAMQGITKEDNDPKVRTTPMTGELDHGTGTAGCAAAVTGNGKGIASTGNRCRYIPIKCGSDNPNFANKILRGYEAILYAARLGAKIINCSWGGPGSSPAEQDIINQAVASGSLVVVAAGNDTKNVDDGSHYPSGYENVLCVGATQSNDRTANFSNFGVKVDVWAPGAGIRTTKSGNIYGDMDGTSFACPITSGVAALVRSLHPDWTPRQVAHQLRATCDNVVATTPANRPRYYGRINAYAALNTNRTLNQGTTAPGLEITQIQFNNQPMITSIGQENAVFTIENVLSNASNVSVNIQPLDSRITLSKSDFTLSSVEGGKSATFQCSVQVKQPAYWYQEDGIMALATITAGSYVNYQYISFPVKISTPNVYTNMTADVPYTWAGAHSKPPLSLWAVGRGSNRSIVYRGGGNMDSSITAVLNCIYGINASTAVTGADNGAVYRTANSAQNWQQISVSSICGAVYSVNFFDNNNGIILGTPSGGWWTGVTTDGGQSWKRGVALPAPTGSETAVKGSAQWLGDNGWMGTTLGRIFRSSDKGQTWQSATVGSGVVTDIAFANAQLGFALLRPGTATTGAATVYATTDGGASWKSTGYVFNQSGVHPVYAYAPLNSTQFLALCSGSQVMMSVDSGRTWSPALSLNGTSAQAGFGTTQGTSTATLYMFGSTVANLRIPLVSGGTRSLNIASALLFDSTEVNATLAKQLDLQNNGTADVSISSISITPQNGTQDGEFSLQGGVPTTVAAGKTVGQSIAFKPKTIGEKKATLTIKSNVNSGDIIVQLTGYGKNVISTKVEEYNSNDLLISRVSPNPADEQVFFSVMLPTASSVALDLYSLSGEKVQSIVHIGTEAGEHLLTLHTAPLAAGVYLYRVRVGASVTSGSLVIEH